ncbi:MAG: thioredoxin domain-containing protein [SAR324 cluster bacterium]|nr:thioredoxin domain-containing protein [SAR324 cluster bacterium]
MKIVKYILAYALGLSLLVTLVFAKTNLLTDSTNSTNQIESNKSKPTSLLNEGVVFATVDGDDYTLDDLIGVDGTKIEQEIYGLLQRGLYDVIKEKYAADLPAVDAVTTKEVQDFYDDNDLQNRGSFNDFKGQIAEFLKTKREQEVIQKFISEAIELKKVVIHQTPPEPDLINFLNKAPTIDGNPDAKVVIIEFTDLQCPFCQKIQPTLESLIDNYQDRVGFYFYHFPLISIHPNAFTASLALECAHDQGNFANYKNRLFAEQSKFSKQDLLNQMKDIGLKGDKMKAFAECLESEKYLAKVESDIKLGKKLNVTGTPTFFIGTFDAKSKEFMGKPLVGSHDYKAFADLLDEYLNQ